MANWVSYSGENHQTLYDSSYETLDFNHNFQSSSTFGDSAFYDPMNYYSYNYYNNNNYASETSSVSVGYSVFTLSEPKHVVYDPNCYYSVCEIENPSEFRISYSVSEFNETDFEEYDPTPYGGGYDISATYGHALPPSEKTCYPIKFPTLESFPLDSVGESLEKDKGFNGFVSESAKDNKPIQTIQEEEEEDDDDDDDDDDDEGDDDDDDEDKVVNGFVSESAKDNKPIQTIQEEDDDDDDDDDDGDDHDDEVRVRYIPSGYGLEAMDLCETIFGGYFPCLLRKQRRDDSNNPTCVSCCGRNDSDPWKTTSDYLFGDLDPYDCENRDGRSSSEAFYGYEWR